MEQGTRNKKGFTIIEVLVAIGLFSVVAAIAVGGFARALRTQRQAQLLLAVNSNVSAALEMMAREIRTGIGFSIQPGDFPGYAFTNAKGEAVWYIWRRDLGELWRRVFVPPTFGRGGGFVGGKITGDNVRVTNAKFSVQGTGKSNPSDPKAKSDDGFPPRVTIALEVVASTTDPAIAASPVRLQTTVSARLMDDEPPALQVRKKVENQPPPVGGTATSSDFTLAVVGNKVRPCERPADMTKQDEEAAVEKIRNGRCKELFEPPSAPNVCFFHGSEAGTWVTLAKGAYCVDELQYTNYTRRFERDCKGSIGVNEVKYCDVYNSDTPLQQPPNP
jgi:prepilin-type N-terminal cleavage/methylation domain-containing protein